ALRLPAKAGAQDRPRSRDAPRLCVPRLRSGWWMWENGRRASCRLQPVVGLHPALARTLRKVADAADVGLPLRHGDDAARIQQVEDVAGLDRLFVGGQRQVLAEQQLAHGLRVLELAQQ